MIFPLPITYSALLRLFKNELKHTPLAREMAIAAGIRIGGGVAVEVTPKLYGTFAPGSLADSEFGYIGEYPASLTEFNFPSGAGDESCARLGDMRLLGKARMLANVTSAGNEDSTLLFSVDDGEEVRGFVDEAPSVPLDVVGLHVSEWRTFAWDATELGERKVRTHWIVSNPSGAAGSFSVGLCQVQVASLAEV
jgi:hypothetical protein